MNAFEYNIPSIVTIYFEDAEVTGLGNATDNESLDSQLSYHQNEEDTEDAEEVTMSDLQAMKQMIKEIYDSPQLFDKYLPEYLKSCRLTTATAGSSFHSEPSRSCTAAGTCSDDPATSTSTQDCIAASDDDNNKLKATRRDTSRKLLLHPNKEAARVPSAPPRRNSGHNKSVIPTLSPPPFHSDGKERLRTKCPTTPRKVSPIFSC